MKTFFTTSSLLTLLVPASVGMPAVEVPAINALAVRDPQAPNAVIPPATLVSLTGQKTDGAIKIGPAPEGQDTQALQKRGAIVVVLGIAAVKGAAILTKLAIEIGSDTIKNLGEWNESREAFTKKTVEEMWNRNPDYTKFPATVCYNKGYRTKNGNLDGLVSAKFELGLLNTDYDCMFIGGDNQFFTDSDNGFVNLAYMFNPERCNHDTATGDLTCT
ncbi:hypothetical protein GQ44DRAFT_690355 [Phaeosphaeriaceae sp. PMI808]|nr:hypothetical protein GQ44DRAFT_690355 [Phaeosphaeriaceae sp. PMI808]